ncbi:MAG TPA: hypothetical protein V6C97_10105 [Oculatellaceae cyanobacterium]
MKSRLLELIELERHGSYVFHGSGKSHKQLEPRQAYTVVDGQSVKDGDPAIFASELVDYAIFMALIGVNWIKGCRASCNFENNRLIFGANQLTIEQLTDSTIGFVHVLERRKFEPRGGIEWLCKSVVKPSQVLQVSVDDFHRTINILSDP